jgi:hypothetical protein
MGLLDRRGYQSRRRGGFGNSVVDSAPDECINKAVGEGYLSERLDAVRAETLRVDSGV